MKALSDDAPVQSSPVPVQSDSLPDPSPPPLVRTRPLGRSERGGSGEEDTCECVDIMSFMPWKRRKACWPVK